MSAVRIQEAKISDAVGIARVHVKTWQSAYTGLVPDDFLKKLSIQGRAVGWKKQLEKPDKGNRYFVGVINRQIVGWCATGKCRDEDTTLNNGEVYGIYVLPEYNGKGIGSQLMKTALTKLKEDGYMTATLWVLSTNEKSKKWYKSKGWKPDGKTKIDHHRGIVLHESRYAKDL